MAGFTTPDINEAMIKECAMKHTQRPYVLCDSRKFHQVSPVSFGEFHAAQIITDCMGRNLCKLSESDYCISSSPNKRKHKNPKTWKLNMFPGFLSYFLKRGIDII